MGVAAVVLRPQGGVQILAAMSPEEYLLANQPSKLERLQLQSRVWEPNGRQPSLQTQRRIGRGLTRIDRVSSPVHSANPCYGRSLR